MTRLHALLAAALLCAAAAVPAPAQTLEEAREHFLTGNYPKAGALFQSLAQANPGDAALRGWLAQAHYRLGDMESALATARGALEIDPCEAPSHTVIAMVHVAEWDREGARDSIRVHATRATECAPDDGNAWLAHWASAMGRQDGTALRVAMQNLARLRFVPEPVMELGRWMLRSAPANAVIVASGDWDYFPMLVAQAEGVRPDVYVVLRPYLEFPWYVRQVARETGLPVPPQVAGLGDDEWNPLETDEPGGLSFHAGAAWARATLDGAARPLSIVFTADPDLVWDAAWPRWDGAVYTLRPLAEAPADGELRIHEASFVASMAHLRMESLHGPLVHPSDR
ncbi:MAG TPA: tetratricopeptide repeat protein, partial [Longimicrobium sp.]|nr:tetratricopeptide repeat protein [Longimicrobium sp.]